MSGIEYLDLNDRRMALDDEAVFALVIAAAAGRLDVEEIAERLSRVEG